MKRFTTEGTNEQKGRELIPALRNREARTLSRRQALGLLGGSLAGFSLLSSGLAAPAKAEAVAHTHIEGPSAHGFPLLSAAPAGNWWNLTLEWTCVFSASAVNSTFQTAWTLMEQDTSDDDVVDARVAPHVHDAQGAWRTFIPSQVAPSNPQRVRFKSTRIWHDEDLDTELGGEELYAYVDLEGPGAWSDWSISQILPLSPGGP